MAANLIPAIPLLPCPFCGGRAVFRTGEHNHYDVKIECEQCYAEGPIVDDHYENIVTDPEPSVLENMKGAAEHWNHRWVG